MLSAASAASAADAALADGDVPASPPSDRASDPSANNKPPVVVWPTMTPAGDAPRDAALHEPSPGAEKDLYEKAEELNATLRDAVQDLGFTLFVAETGPSAGHTRDQDLVERAGRSAAGGEAAGGTWVVSPRIEQATGGGYLLRVVVVPPGGRELRVRVETAAADAVGVRGLVMLRDLLSPAAAAQAVIERDREQAATGSSQGIMSPLRSQGRAVLAVNAGLLGGFGAFSVQRASGSDDPRVLYPLLALGAGVGVGAALLVADEWDVTTGDAWVLSAGAFWGASAGFLIAGGYSLEPVDDRYSWAVGGGLLGAGLATFALTRTSMDDGDAMLTHSGGLLGLLLGGATELLGRGTTLSTLTPSLGMGSASAPAACSAPPWPARSSFATSRPKEHAAGLPRPSAAAWGADSPDGGLRETQATTRARAGSLAPREWGFLARPPAPAAESRFTASPGAGTSKSVDY
ncbi:MAG: hypothetical protein ABSC94_14460 [Polyangiaceae bacterium]